MRLSGARAVMKALEDEGVKYIYGYPGGAVIPLYDELLKTDKIEHILVRNEQAAAHAASGQSRSTDTVGVCLATSGPGATNLVTGIATAFMDSVPMIIVTGQVPTSMVGTDAFQEVDITGITLPIVKHSYLVKEAKNIPQIFKDAFHIANSGRKGPVLIDIPKDVQLQEFEYVEPHKTNRPGYKPNYHPNKKQIKRVLQQFSRAKKPLILLGGGMVFSKAYPELKELLKKINAPIISTLMGLSAIDNTHDNFFGMLGLHGTVAANYAVSKCDFLLSLGARFDDRTTIVSEKFSPNAVIAHVDIDPAEIGKNIETNIPIVSDLRNFLQELLPQLNTMDFHEFLQEVKEMDAKFPMRYNDCGTRLCPQYVLEKVSELTDGDAIITTEVGQHQMFTAQYYKFKQPGSFITSGGLGTMGYGLPAAIGAAKSNPDKLVINVAGDGSLQMNLPEIATALEQNLPIKILLFNNSSLNLVRQLQYHATDKRYSGIDFTMNPDFNKLVESYPGAASYRINHGDDVESILKEALSNGKFTLINCITNTSEMVYPIASPVHGLTRLKYVDEEQIEY